MLNATTMKEIGRAEFDLVGPAAKPLHGCFTPHKGNENYVFCHHDLIYGCTAYLTMYLLFCHCRHATVSKNIR